MEAQMIIKKKEKKDDKPKGNRRFRMKGDESKKSKRIRHPNKF